MAEQNANGKEQPAAFEFFTKSADGSPLPKAGKPFVPSPELSKMVADFTAEAVRTSDVVRELSNSAQQYKAISFDLPKPLFEAVAPPRSEFMEAVARERFKPVSVESIFRDPMVEMRERERRQKLYARRVDGFIRWAWADKARRRGEFDAYAVPDTSKADVAGIMLEAIDSEFFQFADAERRGLELPEDHKGEAHRRTIFTRDGLDDAYLVRFTRTGLAHARMLWLDAHRLGYVARFLKRNGEQWAADWVGNLISHAAVAIITALAAWLWFGGASTPQPATPASPPQVAPAR